MIIIFLQGPISSTFDCVKYDEKHFWQTSYKANGKQIWGIVHTITKTLFRPYQTKCFNYWWNSMSFFFAKWQTLMLFSMKTKFGIVDPKSTFVKLLWNNVSLKLLCPNCFSWNWNLAKNSVETAMSVMMSAEQRRTLRKNVFVRRATWSLFTSCTHLWGPPPVNRKRFNKFEKLISIQIKRVAGSQHCQTA